VHLNDWQTALGAWFLRAEHGDDPWLAGARSVFTIHNLAYQGMYPKEAMDAVGLPWSIFRFDRGVEFHDQLNFMKAGLSFADALTTVSPNYAREILTVEGGYGLDTVLRGRSGDLFGILNGIDDREWDPSRDPHLPARYDRHDLRGKARVKAALQAEMGLPVKAHVPLVGLVGRLADQKGVDLVAGAMPALLRADAQFALLGSGQREYQDFFSWLARERPDRFAARIGFDEGVAHRIEAGADVFLMPSRFEPCGLNQMYSLRYGTPPIVRATGSLADTVVDVSDATLADKTANGFVFEEATPHALWLALERATRCWHDRKLWQRIQQNGMRRDFSWQHAARDYAALYRDAAAARR
jgi:starch synthase